MVPVAPTTNMEGETRLDQRVRAGGADLEDVPFGIDRIASLSRRLPGAPEHLDAERFQPRPLRFYVLHFKDEFHQPLVARRRRSCDFDLPRDLRRNGVQRKPRAARIEGCIYIRP